MTATSRNFWSSSSKLARAVGGWLWLSTQNELYGMRNKREYWKINELKCSHAFEIWKSVYLKGGMLKRIKHKNPPIHGRINKMLYILSPSAGFELQQENTGGSRSRRLWGHSGKREDSYWAWKTLGHQTQGHGHACGSLSKSCELFPVPTVIPGYREVAAAQKGGVWLSFSNGGQLSPTGSPLARVTQGGREGGWVFMSEAGISALVAPRGPWARWVGRFCCPHCMYFWSFYFQHWNWETGIKRLFGPHRFFSFIFWSGM